MTLKRLRWPPADLGQAYRVFVDHTQIGEIRRRETKTFEVAPGPHEVYLELAWCSSRVVDVDLSPGEEVRLVCKAKNPLGGWNVLNRRSYMALEIDEAAAQPEA